ncbi:hypothetical protein GCM10022224_027610 [Nonomuraea antimicrobica]|uniref:Secreted protein n=1 Tax=Nonomuraea antimicrobica TaxID=561173 RepID=A0ABP7BKS5_9ACTN
MIAVAALTAGVCWLSTGPTTAQSCPGTEPSLLSPTAIASYCDEHAKLRVNDGGPGSGRMVTKESNKLAMAAGDLARHLGLTGLATGKEVLGVADLGGVAATWGMPSLTSASPALFPMVPGPLGMKDLSTMAGVPALPSLPELPALPALPQEPQLANLPAELSLGQATHQNRIAGTGIQSPLDLKQPVREVGADVIGELLPKAVESVEGTSMLPGGELVVSGFTGLAQQLGLK